MTIHLHKFVDRLRGAEARGLKDFSMSMQDAKDLHADLTRLLLQLQSLQETQTKPVNNEVVKIEVRGGSF